MIQVKREFEALFQWKTNIKNYENLDFRKNKYIWFLNLIVNRHNSSTINKTRDEYEQEKNRQDRIRKMVWTCS